MTNQGQQKVNCVSNDGDAFGITYQIAEVPKALTSVGSICDAGDGENFVMFSRTGGYIASPQLGTVTSFTRSAKGALYLFSQWVKKSNVRESAASPLGRQDSQ